MEFNFSDILKVLKNFIFAHKNLFFPVKKKKSVNQNNVNQNNEYIDIDVMAMIELEKKELEEKLSKKLSEKAEDAILKNDYLLQLVKHHTEIRAKLKLDLEVIEKNGKYVKQMYVNIGKIEQKLDEMIAQNRTNEVIFKELQTAYPKLCEQYEKAKSNINRMIRKYTNEEKASNDLLRETNSLILEYGKETDALVAEINIKTKVFLHNNAQLSNQEKYLIIRSYLKSREINVIGQSLPLPDNSEAELYSLKSNCLDTYEIYKIVPKVPNYWKEILENFFVILIPFPGTFSYYAIFCFFSTLTDRVNRLMYKFYLRKMWEKIKSLINF